MSNLKGKVSLFLVIIMMMTSILPIFTVSAAENVVNEFMTLTATISGKKLSNLSEVIITPEATDRKINVSVDAASIVDLEIYYSWNGAAPKLASTGSKTATITVPNFKAGTKNELQIEAIIDDDENDLIGNSNILKLYFTVPADEATTVESTLKNGSKSLSTSGKNELEVGTKLTLSGTSNKKITTLAYKWDNEGGEIIKASSTTVVVPEFKAGSTHTLTIQAATEDGVGSEPKTYTIVIPAKEVVEPTTVEATLKNGSKTLSTSGKHELAVGTKLTLSGTSNKKITNLAYKWDNEGGEIIKASSTTVVVPEFKAGSTHTLTIQAATEDGVGSEPKTYTIVIPAKEVVEPTTVEATLKNGSKTLSTSGKHELAVGTKLTLSGTSNKKITNLAYKWDNEGGEIIKASSTTVVVPEFKAGSTHTLTIQAATEDGVGSESKTYTIVIPAAVVNPPAEEIDDELVTEEWMKESSELDALSVSLRNGSDEDKQNKNIYVLGEEVIYYIDYANGTSKDIDNAKIVFETELAFDVVDAFGGKVDGKKVTWEFPNGIEEGQTGTKVLVLKYNSLGKSSVKSKVINPVADIYKGTKVADSSAVINLIFKDEETEITNDEHYPYMKGDADKPTFRPDDGITRAEGALVLTRIFGMSTSGTTVSNEYSDLGETYLEAQKAIVAASKAGLINGYEDGTYKPNKKMTRAEFMKIIAANIELVAEEDDVRGLEIKTSDEEIKIYKDPTKSYVVGNATVNEHWASSYVTFLARLNMTSASKKEKDLRLDEPITRAEVAQLVNFYLLRAPADDVKTTQFTDVSKNHKLFGDIVEATRDAHTYFLTVEGTEIVED